MNAGLEAARSYVEKSSLPRGYTLRLIITDSGCSTGHVDVAMADFGRRLSSNSKPDLIVGAGGCSSVATPLQGMIAAMGIPIIGVAAGSGSLSSRSLFVRYTSSYDAAGQLAGSVARFVGLNAVGAVYEPSLSQSQPTWQTRGSTSLPADLWP